MHLLQAGENHSSMQCGFFIITKKIRRSSFNVFRQSFLQGFCYNGPNCVRRHIKRVPDECPFEVGIMLPYKKSFILTIFHTLTTVIVLTSNSSFTSTGIFRPGPFFEFASQCQQWCDLPNPEEKEIQPAQRQLQSVLV